MSPRQIAHAHRISDTTFYARLRRGWCWYRAATTPTRPYFYEWSM